MNQIESGKVLGYYLGIPILVIFYFAFLISTIQTMNFSYNKLRWLLLPPFGLLLYMIPK